ncbi:thioredoxin family protein [Pseudomonas coronafaciens]|uniref:thioredoxin family protein n=1 Tax=Pseudomonas coronafaciens TaxID=53409 RepID=UPI001F419061|nr:thioredoxin domain-containing protein [Pseudomonas coronafaciens]
MNNDEFGKAHVPTTLLEGRKKDGAYYPLYSAPQTWRLLSFLSVDAFFSQAYVRSVINRTKGQRMSVITVTDAIFQKEVVEASHHKLVAVEFSTKGKEKKASAKMDVIFDDLAEKYAEKAILVRVYIELDLDLEDSLNPVASKEYKINCGPTIVFFKAGKRAREDIVGLQTNERMVRVLDELLLTS